MITNPDIISIAAQNFFFREILHPGVTHPDDNYSDIVVNFYDQLSLLKSDTVTHGPKNWIQKVGRFIKFLENKFTSSNASFYVSGKINRNSCFGIFSLFIRIFIAERL